MRIWIRITAFSLQICGLEHQVNLRSCYVRINHYKFADLRFADWHTLEIWGFAIAEWAQEFADLRDLRGMQFADSAQTRIQGDPKGNW